MYFFTGWSNVAADDALTPMDVPGTLGLAGRYRLIARLGRGGMADVFLAVMQGPGSFNKLCVIKRLRSVVADDEHHVRMFLDEAKLSARLNHPNVVQTYEFGSDQGSYFIVMEYLEGQPLKRLMKAVQRKERGWEGLTRTAWVRIVAEMLKGLHYAHELSDYSGKPLGIVHRDVSPHNIFVTYDGAVKVVDFGVAKAALNAERTETGVFKGKVAYMAPEQATAAKTVDCRADVFAAGIVLWELITGRRLFEGDYVTTIHQLTLGEIPRPSAVVSGVPPALERVTMKALERDRAKRFSSAREMSEALEAYLHASGEVFREEHLGARLLAIFEGARAALRLQITAQTDRPAKTASSGDDDEEITVRISTVGVGSAVFATGSLNSLPYLGDQSHSGVSGREVRGSEPVPGDSASLRAATVPARKGARSVLVGALGLAGLLAVVSVAVFVLGRRGSGPPGPKERAEGEPVATAQDEGPRYPVQIASDPPDALVSWKGKELGRTPITAQLPAGTQVVVISRPDSFDETLVLTVSPNDTLSRSVKLRPKDVLLPTQARPAGE